MAVDDRHTVRVRADRHRMRLDAVPSDPAEDLLCLALHLLFFAADERHHVPDDVERGDTRIPRTRHRLHRRDDDRSRFELAQRGQHHRQEDSGAVRIRYDGATPASRGALPGGQREMVGVDLRDEQRHNRVHAEVPRVADDDVAGLREGPFDVASHRRVERREDNLRPLPGHTPFDLAVRKVLGYGPRQTPRRRLTVAAPFRAFARREPGQREPWMSRELQRELLADHAGRAQDTNVNAIHSHK